MGKDVYSGSAAARAAYDASDEALGTPLSRVCFEGPMEDLTRTANTQPAIVTTSVAILAALRERIDLPEPDCAAGHSLGEYSALVAAGALSLPDAVTLCRVRGAAMQEAVPQGQGAMAALMGLVAEDVRALCLEAAGDDVVSAANFNTPTQTVIAGHAAAVERAGELAAARGARVIPLKVSAPFHCALMAAARGPLGEALEAVTVSAPKFDVLANVDACPKPDPKAIAAALLEQVDHTVEWVTTIEAMRDRGVTHALEIGPGRVLAGLCKRITKDMKVLSISSIEAIDRARAFLDTGH